MDVLLQFFDINLIYTSRFCFIHSIHQWFSSLYVTSSLTLFMQSFFHCPLLSFILCHTFWSKSCFKWQASIKTSGVWVFACCEAVQDWEPVAISQIWGEIETKRKALGVGFFDLVSSEGGKFLTYERRMRVRSVSSYIRSRMATLATQLLEVFR